MEDKDELTEDEKDMKNNMPLAVENIECMTEEINDKTSSIEARMGNMESELKSLRQNQFHGTRRPGLYYMAGIAALASVLIYDKTDGINTKLDNLKPHVQTSNVLGAEAPEKFYDIDGQRVYLEIDGKPVAEYLKGRQ